MDSFSKKTLLFIACLSLTSVTCGATLQQEHSPQTIVRIYEGATPSTIQCVTNNYLKNPEGDNAFYFSKIGCSIADCSLNDSLVIDHGPSIPLGDINPTPEQCQLKSTQVNSTLSAPCAPDAICTVPISFFVVNFTSNTDNFSIAKNLKIEVTSRPIGYDTIAFWAKMDEIVESCIATK